MSHSQTERLCADLLSEVFYAGDEAGAKDTVRRLAGSIGFEPVDGGPLANARYLEPLGMLNIWLGYVGGRGTNIAPRWDTAPSGALPEATLSAKPMIWGSFCVPLLPVNSHVAVDVTERMVRSEVEQPAAGLDPIPLVGAFGDLSDQVGLTRDRLGGSTQLCFERF